MHTRLYSSPRHSKRDFVTMLLWERRGDTWKLAAHLFEVTPTAIRRVAGAEALATRGQRPAAGDTVDPDTLVAIRLNQYGMAARQAALARVDYAARYDVSRLPALRYTTENGCGRFMLVGFSDDRSEALVIRVDREALGLKTASATIAVYG